MKIKFSSAILVLFIMATTTTAQLVETITLDITTKFDGLLVHSDGYIYGSEGHDGSKIYKITPDGITSEFVGGLSGPINMVEDSIGNIYVTEWNTGRVKKITPDGEASIFVDYSGRAGAAGMDSEGNIYVNFKPLSGGNGTLRKFSPDGELLNTYTNSMMVNPSGIAFDEEGNMYLGELFSGNLLKVNTDDEFELLGSAPTPSGNHSLGKLLFFDGFLYSTDLGNHVVYKISLDGVFTILAGMLGQPGSQDGMGEEARFSNPNGLAISGQDSTLFVKKGYTANNKLRKITLNVVVSHIADNSFHASENELAQNAPNPADERTSIFYELVKDNNTLLRIFDVNGNEIKKLINKMQPKGKYQIDLDTSGFDNGIYYIILSTPGFSKTRKMIIKH